MSSLLSGFFAGAIAMARYPQNAGAAAALFGSSRFGLGMWASAAVSYHHDGSGRPMVGVIVATTAASLAGYLLYRRSAR
jgi:DHA1 family bicyclomycin/chloramphenicol resistance-like MFS transporter